MMAENLGWKDLAEEVQDCNQSNVSASYAIHHCGRILEWMKCQKHLQVIHQIDVELARRQL
jgi:hypothetical protein